MADLTLRAIKAKNGDSVLLFADGATVLIDGAPSGVYPSYLRDQLEALEGASGDTPVIDLLIVSHIDSDHIAGILDLTDELIEARDEERDPIVRLHGAWHNSFADTIAKLTGASAAATRSEAASVASAFEALDIPGFDPHESKLILSSVAQGRQLRLDLKALNIELNRQFRDRLVLVDNVTAPWTRGALRLDVVGPGQAELDKLRDEWAEQLEKILAKEADAATAARGMDMSVTNLASIVVIAKAGGRTVLLTGDARGEMVLGWLEQAGYMAAGGKAHFDILKLPHHGSDRNVTEELFRRVTADHYVVSGDGKHGNPEPHTLSMLFEARPALDYTVHMTYAPDELAVHKEFIKDGLVAKLQKVLSDPARKAVLNYPQASGTFVDIAV